MESLSPFLWRTCTSYNMPVYPGARRIVAQPEVFQPAVIFLSAARAPIRAQRVHMEVTVIVLPFDTIAVYGPF